MEVLEFLENPRMMDPMCLYIPGHKQIINMIDGGDPEITDEDMKNGYKDYVACTVYTYDHNPGFRDIDWADIKLKFLLGKDHPLSECIPIVLQYFYDNPNTEYIVLE